MQVILSHDESYKSQKSIIFNATMFHEFIVEKKEKKKKNIAFIDQRAVAAGNKFDACCDLLLSSLSVTGHTHGMCNIRSQNLSILRLQSITQNAFQAINHLQNHPCNGNLDISSLCRVIHSVT